MDISPSMKTSSPKGAGRRLDTFVSLRWLTKRQSRRVALFEMSSIEVSQASPDHRCVEEPSHIFMS